MYTWKSIPKSDYTIRKFYAYKNWSFPSGSDVLLLSASNAISYNQSEEITVGNITYSKQSLYGSINSKYYSIRDVQSILGNRVLHDTASVFSVPNEYLGEGIKEGSLTIVDDNSTITLTDNTSGSLMSGSVVVGDIFYKDGIVVYTHTASIKDRFIGDWDFNFKSIQEITENEIFISVGKNEFNVSRNPTAVYTKTLTTHSIAETDKNPAISIVNYGLQYVRKKNVLENGTVLDYRYGSKTTVGVSGGFEHYYLSSSTDSTGSFLTTYVTTIGLYDDANELMAVAKLPKPIKLEPSYPVNFIIRFDT
jgi:hypothetical protein